jgi:hypothetical protein
MGPPCPPWRRLQTPARAPTAAFHLPTPPGPSCLLSKCYNAGAPLVAADIFRVEPSKTAVGPTDLLLYCYHGGMVAAGVG